MSYTIDVYRGTASPARRFSDISCFVSLFPHLVAGPIVRYNILAEQIQHRTHTLDKFSAGIAMFILGFAKKILLANPMGQVADAVFGAATPLPLDAWIGVIAYAFQIYFDFSGYSDMAIGLGRMFGFVIPENFRSPYLSESITDFWRRWHISLSTWLRDYLYLPLGGNRRGPRRTYINLCAGDAARRTVAWSGVAVSGVGRVSRIAAGVRTLDRQEESIRVASCAPAESR